MRRSLTNRPLAIGLVLLTGAVGVVFAARTGGAAAAVLAAIAVACAVGLVVRIEPASAESRSISQIFDWALLALPAALVIYFSFDSGGYFPASPAFVAIVLVIVLVLRVTLVDEPFAASSLPLAVAACGLAGFVLWVLVSALWSDATARALIEFDRDFMYLLLLVLMGSVIRTSDRLRWLAGGVALGVLVVAIGALATRLVPDHFPTKIPAIGPQELSYPLTYSNGLGILCVLGAVLFLYFATSTRLPAITKAIGAAALPILATTVYLTLSRGPVAAAFVGIVAFLLFGRPRGLLTGIVAVVPASVIAVASAYQHHLLTSATPTTAAAAQQGHRVAVVVGACAIGAGLLRLVLTPLDARLADYSLPARSRTPVLVGASAATIIVVLGIALAAHAPRRISDQYHRFVDTAEAGPGQDIRKSVFDPSNRGLIDNWSVSLKSFDDSPVHGTGAGTYEVVWFARRPAKQAGYDVTDGHSLYTEVLGELGIVGFLLIVTVVLAILFALRPWGRGPNRGLYAALFATTLAWAVHAGVDWDWEMPAITVIPIALGGAGLAAHASKAVAPRASQGVRVGLGLLLLFTAIGPALVLASQRQLNDAVDAQRAGNCSRAVDRAAASIETLSIRPEPYEVLALCQVKRGRPGLAVDALQRAVDRDPNNWRYHFELAAIRGGAGLDPRPDLLAARRLNPHDTEITDLLASIPKGDSASWDLALALPSGASAKP